MLSLDGISSLPFSIDGRVVYKHGHDAHTVHVVWNWLCAFDAIVQPSSTFCSLQAESAYAQKLIETVHLPLDSQWHAGIWSRLQGWIVPFFE